jgi:hypothetical protein
MCDFSLQYSKSRPAVVADRLTTHNFGRGTNGFKGADEPIGDATAVCVLPGTEIAFDKVPQMRACIEKKLTDKVARFRQINKDQASAHHDALEFPDGQIILLTYFEEGQHATVLQLPAAPRTAAEEKEQERLPVTA